LTTLAARTQAHLVQRVGNVGVFYRRAKDVAKILIPD
jgi:RNA-binding protein YhbY